MDVMTKLAERRELFWDVAESEIPTLLIHAPEWVVPRVFEYGTVADIDAVIRHYGSEKVSAILHASTMRPVTRAMAFLFLGIDPAGYYAS